MGTLVIYGVVAIALAAALFLLASYLLPAGEQIAPVLRDEPLWELPPERRMQADDVETVRLPVALRGYRFAETDLLLDRLAEELRLRDAELARLRGADDPAAVEDEGLEDEGLEDDGVAADGVAADGVGDDDEDASAQPPEPVAARPVTADDRADPDGG